MIKRTLLAGSVAVMALSTSAAFAAEVDLGFIVDSSGSVGNSEFSNTMNALKAALNTINISDPNVTYTVSIVSFSDTATKVTATPIRLDSAANLAALNTAIDNAAYIGSTTNYVAAMQAMKELSGNLGDVSILNFATDGDPVPTTGQDQVTLVAKAGELIGEGWDSMSFEAIGTALDAGDRALLGAMGFDTALNPTPTGPADFLNGPAVQGGCSQIGSSAQIVNTISECFVIETTFADMTAVYNKKIVNSVITTGGTIDPIPVPAALPLLAGGLGIFGLMGWRRRKAA
ncbi:VWA domain-containing protein [Sedimentitalea sp. JM2-8]|uniref:VWA domain-containing protein n=1 Tax=Sedimentitalea xiamensis TaxID=3050037 RepID=A0ABT7FAS9_9RHOB|nr:VWA domain-containing protein [Sedimentitalea xiamensis]MDK3072219.1 VWA domain-containing protein [Sedimentitalea xiamensis]